MFPQFRFQFFSLLYKCFSWISFTFCKASFFIRNTIFFSSMSLWTSWYLTYSFLSRVMPFNLSLNIFLSHMRSRFFSRVFHFTINFLGDFNFHRTRVLVFQYKGLIDNMSWYLTIWYKSQIFRPASFLILRVMRSVYF